MAKGKKTGGRKTGSVNKKTKELAAVTNGEQTPLEMLLEVMRDTKQFLPLRMEAAKTAAPYVHPRKAQELNIKGSIQIIEVSTNVHD